MKGPTEPTTITVHVPMTFTIRGGRKAIIIKPTQLAHEEPNQLNGTVSALSTPGRSPPQRTENALLKALARAHRWQQMIEKGLYGSITELARAENVNESYACRILRLTLLAPSIVTEILDGRCPADLQLKHAMRPLPVRWDEQIEALRRPGCLE